MRSTPFFSVIVPNFNHASFLRECLLSVKHQFFTEFECVLYDDGSTDDSIEVARELIGDDSRFKVIGGGKNVGLSTARNLAIAASKGAWILPLDSDDYISLNFLQEAYNRIKNDDMVRFVVPLTQMFGTSNRTIRIDHIRDQDLLLSPILPNCCIYKRKDFEKTGGYDSKLIYSFEDSDMWQSLWYGCDLSNKVTAFVPEIVFFYRQRHDAKSEVTRNDAYKMKYTKKFFLNKHKDVYDRFPEIKKIIEISMA